MILDHLGASSVDAKIPPAIRNIALSACSPGYDRGICHGRLQRTHEFLFAANKVARLPSFVQQNPVGTQLQGRGLTAGIWHRASRRQSVVLKYYRVYSTPAGVGHSVRRAVTDATIQRRSLFIKEHAARLFASPAQNLERASRARHVEQSHGQETSRTRDLWLEVRHALNIADLTDRGGEVLEALVSSQ